MSEEQDKQKNSEKRRQSQMEAFEKNIAQWQHELENPPEVEDIAVILEELVCLCFVFVFIGVSGADGSGSSGNERPPASFGSQAPGAHPRPDLEAFP